MARLTLALALLAANAFGQSPPRTLSAAEQEAFLREAPIVNPSPAPSRASWRVTLDNGTVRHDASIETANGTDALGRDYRRHLAAYEAAKLLGLAFVIPTVERTIGGRPAAITWWVDNYLTNDITRRKQAIEPPDPIRWDAQMQAVRVFDELVGNEYRGMEPAEYTSTRWDNLLITQDWQIWLTDHTRTFLPTMQLRHRESLRRIEPALLARLRALDRGVVEKGLGRYLTREQLDATEARRTLLVAHFDRQR